jgi:hypothetical protein
VSLNFVLVWSAGIKAFRPTEKVDYAHTKILHLQLETEAPHGVISQRAVKKTRIEYATQRLGKLA